MTAETRQFQMHAKLLYDVIRRQAGTLSKAILEGIMNSVDAGATECRITLEPKRVTVNDDGKGFKNREEIEKFFEVFGQLQRPLTPARDRRTREAPAVG